MTVRRFYIGQALNSFADLGRVLHELTEEEVLAALKLEAATHRRPSILERLISRATRLNELSYNLKLKEKFHHGSHSLQDHVGRRKEGG
jgi:hypothetical protein